MACVYYDVLETEGTAMKLIHHKTPLIAAILIALCSAGACADETAGSTSTPDKPNGTLGKVEHGLGVAATATEHGIKKGAKATAHGIKRGVAATAHGIERGAEWTDRAAHKVADKVTGSSSSSSSSSSDK
jgi:hypothetical protein